LELLRRRRRRRGPWPFPTSLIVGVRKTGEDDGPRGPQHDPAKAAHHEPRDGVLDMQPNRIPDLAGSPDGSNFLVGMAVPSVGPAGGASAREDADPDFVGSGESKSAHDGLYAVFCSLVVPRSTFFVVVCGTKSAKIKSTENYMIFLINWSPIGLTGFPISGSKKYISTGRPFLIFLRPN
jgi:hypothetical protein